MEPAPPPPLPPLARWRSLAATLNPFAPLRRRFQRWWQARLPLSDTLALTQRHVYLLPFLLAGSAVIGMHICHANLRGLTLHLKAPEPHFMGSSTAFDIQLSS